MFFWSNSEAYPLYIILIDGVFSLLMLIMIVRFLTLTLSSDHAKYSKFRFIQTVSTATTFTFAWLTPASLNARARLLFVCFLLFIIRYYILPSLLGYEVRTPSQLPFESSLLMMLSDLQDYVR